MPYVHPDDATRLGLQGDGRAILESLSLQKAVRIHCTHELRLGVVGLPHGRGHAGSLLWQRVAGERPGVSIND